MEFIEEVIFSGFVSKVINDIVDVSKDKIKIAVKNKNTNHQNLESQIYNVIVDVLNKITSDQYEYDQDSIYDTAEILLKSFKGNEQDEIRNIKSCLRVLNSNVDENKCQELKKILYEELGKDEYSELYRAILLFMLDQKNQYDGIVNEQLGQQLDKVEKKIDKLNQKLNGIKNSSECNAIRDKVVKFQNNRKQEYIENWNSRLFLHLDNDEKPLTLADAFIMPDYKIHKSIERIRFSDNDTLDQIIEKFVKYDRTSTMLITGVPGIGKTSITAWIANEYKEDDKIIVLRFRDWKKEELEKGLLKSIYNTLACEQEDLENKILIIDGFDEMKPLNIREKILNYFFYEILDLEKFKCILTSRPAYINSYGFSNVIELLPFDIVKIMNFYKKITGNELDEKKTNYDNLDVLGIPVILYMAIMSDIDITKNASKAELYNRIFAAKGGIFDRFSREGIAWSNGVHIIRDKKNIEMFLDFLRVTAFKIFERDGSPLSKKDCKIPKFEFRGDSISILEFPIKHLFERTENNIEFIHKSIYEYFVAEYIYMMIKCGDNKVNNELASILGCMLKDTILSPEILEFLEFKIKNDEENLKFEKVYKTFQIMMLNGMTFYTGKKYKNIIQCEINVFCNMLEILHLWENTYIEFNSVIEPYLLCNIRQDTCINLKGVKLLDVDLQKADLKNAILEGTNLKEVKLGEIKLEGASLQEANLEGVNLKGANLRRVKMERANLKNADLRKADLEEANLKEADLEGANLRGADLEGAEIIAANLKNVFLGDANLQKVHLTGTNLERANMMRANMIKANLESTDLEGAKIIAAKMMSINLQNANLRGADLEKTSLMGANLRGVNLQRANLRGADLKESDLTSANLQGANLEAVDLERANLKGTDLRTVWLQGALMSKNDIEKIQLQLRQARFTYIMIKEGNDIKQI